MQLLTKINKPEELNATTVGKLWYQEEARKDPGHFNGSTWQTESADLQKFYVGLVQSMLDCLVHQGILS